MADLIGASRVAQGASSSGASLTETMTAAVRFRTAAVLGLLLFTMIVNTLRLAIGEGQSFEDEPIVVPLAVLSLVLYQSCVLVWLFRRRKETGALPVAWVYSNAVIEGLFPTVLLLLIGTSGAFPLGTAILSPAADMYALFIVLSVLHVRLSVSLTAGAVSAAGYTALVLMTTAGAESGEVAEVLPASLAGFSGVLVLTTGAAAALVAFKTRRYLRSAAMEAEGRARAERDLKTAALIQQSLMPSDPPQIPGFEVYGWNRSADETGGDYFDWLLLDDGRFAVCIADVTGHGLGPAMITCFCRAYARTALRLESRVASALTRLNAELFEDLGDGRFVTFASAILTPSDGKVLSVSAGHGPLLLFRAKTGEVERFNADALPLGIAVTGEDVDAVSHDLDDGDAFVLVTDGFFEWADRSGRQWGTDELVRSLSRHGRKEPDQVVQGLLEDVERFAGGTAQPDDLTAVVIRRSKETDK